MRSYKLCAEDIVRKYFIWRKIPDELKQMYPAVSMTFAIKVLRKWMHNEKDSLFPMKVLVSHLSEKPKNLMPQSLP
ncbi:MAG: hypothetical protein ACYYK0_02805 [Candidatus Eutrophobiaceae bacterium]